MYNQLLISLQIEEKWYTFRLFFGILSCYYLQHTIVEWENADNLHMVNDEPDLTALYELHDSIMQAYKSDKSYPASSFGGNPSTNAMLDLTLQKIIAEYNSQIVKSDISSEEPITFDTLNFTGHYKSPFF